MGTTPLTTLLRSISLLESRGLTEAILAHPVTAVVVDSRQVVAGGLFVAVPGAKIDGRSYIPEAVRRGCVAVVAG